MWSARLRRRIAAAARTLGWRPQPARLQPRAANLQRDCAGSDCPICEQAAPQFSVGMVAPTQAEQFHVEQFQLVECDACQTVYLDPRPTPADLRALYQEGVQFSDDIYTQPARVAAMLLYYGNCLRLHRLLPPRGGRMLEVGAGLAWVARACKAANPDIVTIAQDVTAECAEHCPWVDHYLIGEIAVARAHAPFQLISLTHVIEHLVSPLQALGELAQLLAPGGQLFITAPFRPRDWRPGDGLDAWLAYPYLHVPAHISYLTHAWFDLAARRCDLRLLHWDARQDDDQAFEAVLARR